MSVVSMGFLCQLYSIFCYFPVLSFHIVYLRPEGVACANRPTYLSYVHMVLLYNIYPIELTQRCPPSSTIGLLDFFRIPMYLHLLFSWISTWISIKMALICRYEECCLATVGSVTISLPACPPLSAIGNGDILKMNANNNPLELLALRAGASYQFSTASYYNLYYCHMNSKYRISKIKFKFIQSSPIELAQPPSHQVKEGSGGGGDWIICALFASAHIYPSIPPPPFSQTHSPPDLSIRGMVEQPHSSLCPQFWFHAGSVRENVARRIHSTLLTAE